MLDTFPASLRYQSNSLGLDASTPADSQVSFNLGLCTKYDDYHARDLHGCARRGEGTAIQNQVALATSTTPESPTTNNSAVSESATIGPKPDTADVSVAKHVRDASQLYPGGQIVYSIDYSNMGTLDADESTIVDTVPQG